MFKEICERIRLTKSNLRAIGRMIWRMKYPPVENPDQSEFWFFAILFIVAIAITEQWGLPLITSTLLIWAMRWMVFLGLRTISLLVHGTVSAVQTVWNEIPEGRKKKKREDVESSEQVTDELYESEAIRSLSEQRS